MPQKLSAMRYIKNNKRRTSVLIVSLCLSFVLTYLTRFLLSTTEESFRPLFEYTPKRVQYISLAGSSFGLDVKNLSTEELMPLYEEKNHALAERLKNYDGVKDAYYTEILYGLVTPPIGSMSFEIPLVNPTEVPVLLDHIGATLVEGRLPEQPGELLLEKDSLTNMNFSLGDYFSSTGAKYFRIVGVVECDTYFGCGIPNPDYPCDSSITVLSDGIDNFTEILAKEGIQVRETYDNVLDYEHSQDYYKKEVVDIIGNSTTYISLGITLLLFISLFIVYTTYLRDRREEWCLYSSIGYSRRTIYFSILRELLFTFIVALAIGAVLIGTAEAVLYAVMVAPKGLKCRFFYPDTLFEILCTYVLLLGILQLPVRFSLWKIRTIDALEDDLY